jgi:hypothetical protein
MTKQKTDREMLQACLEAMEISQRGGGSTNWEYMITDVRKHLQVEPAGSPLTDVGRVRLPDEPIADVSWWCMKHPGESWKSGECPKCDTENRAEPGCDACDAVLKTPCVLPVGHEGNHRSRNGLVEWSVVNRGR